MKAVILAGGLGSRLSEETYLKPKPMVEIGQMPIIWHIMKIFSAYGVNEFVVCLGYKGYVIKEFFANYRLHNSDITIDISSNRIDVLHSYVEPWKVTLVDTGADTMTGGRVRRIASYLDGDKEFLLTYGDGVADINIDKLITSHREQGLLATVTAVQPPGRFGGMRLERNQVCDFREKPAGDGAWINGGFFVLDNSVLNLLNNDHDVFETATLPELARQQQLSAYRHSGFWKLMDTLRDKKQLEELWHSGEAPWKVW